MKINKEFARGLVVGKFSPLHQGHELLIRHALARCDETLIISYSKPEFNECGAANRDSWIASLFPSARRLVIDDTVLKQYCQQQGVTFRSIPQNDEGDAIHREFCGWLCWELLHLTVDAVFTSEDYGNGFANSLTRYFRDRAPNAARVNHVCVDPTRKAVPTSGTRIRANLPSSRNFLSPAVASSFVKRACFLGGESTGKTTCAKLLAEHCASTWVPEYGRELWEKKGGALCFADLLEIAQMQIAREDTLAHEARHWLACDTSPLTTLFYSHSLFGKSDPELLLLANRPYDAAFLCAPDFPFVQDGTRRGEDFRLEQHQWYLDELSRRSVAYTLLTGDLASRMNTICKVLGLH